MKGLALLTAGVVIAGAFNFWPGREKVFQAQAVLTVAESKRLIAKGIAESEHVKKALEDGMVIICKGTTNTYVAEELTGDDIDHAAYVLGRVYPEKGGKKLEAGAGLGEIILVNGKWQKEMTLKQAVEKLEAGDVVLKGANALDYENKLAGVLIGSRSAGTTGTVFPYSVARKAHFVIPVGLEKQIAGNMVDIVNMSQQPVEELNTVYSMFLLNGDIFTEIEALKVLADVEAVQQAAGGIGGAQGSVRLVFRGEKDNVQKALDIIGSIQGEPPFVK